MSRRDAQALTAFSQAVEPAALTTLLVNAVEQLLGHATVARPASPRVVSPVHLARWLHDPCVALVLETNDDSPPCAVEVDPRLAHLLIDRTLAGDAALPPHAAGLVPPREIELGALSYALGEVFSRSRPTIAWRMRAWLTQAAALRAWLNVTAAVEHTVTFALTEHDVTWLRLWWPVDREITAERRAQPHCTALLPTARCELSVIGGSIRATLRTLRELRLGDAIMMDTAWVTKAANGAWEGRARVDLARSARPLGWAHATADVRLAADLEPHQFIATRERPTTMQPPSDETDAVLAERAIQLAGDTPLDLTVELARVTVPLAELAAWRAGTIVPTGQPLGARVTLRMGDRVVALGDLINIDGEVGVRLLKLADS